MSTAVAPSPATDNAAAPPSKRRTMVIALLVVAVLAGAGWYFFLRPTAESAPQPGEVAQIEPIQVNLAGGHYLRLGLALQLVEGAHEVDGSKALDAAIGVFSGRSIAEVNEPKTREDLRDELTAELDHRYHGDVLGVYFTEYVTQ